MKKVSGESFEKIKTFCVQ